jgi:hypothetical protein
VEPLGRPAVVGVEGFEDEERFAELRGAFDGALQAEVPGRPPRSDHPVEDVVAVGPDGSGVAGLDAESRNHGVMILRTRATGTRSDPEGIAATGTRSVESVPNPYSPYTTVVYSA